MVRGEIWETVMIRAISYTVMFCAASTGAALGLAYVHDAKIGSAGPVVAHVAPQATPQSTLDATPLAVAFAPMADEAQQTPRVAPIMQPAMDQTMSAPVTTAPAQQTVRALAPKATNQAPERRVVGMSTQGQSEFSPRSFDFTGPSGDVARTVPLFEQAQTDIPQNLRKTWNTGVYR